MKNVNRLEKRLEKFLGVEVPERFEKRDGEIYGLLHGEWRPYSIHELTVLKNKLKTQDGKHTGNPTNIEVIIVGRDEEREILYEFEDGWVVDEKGISLLIIVNLVTGDEESEDD
ncbi:MAG: hypothetical protein WC194_13195 [Mesotoga sp.]|uniref:hypothetical protein n=1 Tax=Mesotoga sp. TaxID=2053577 RepID=UPI0035641421